MLNLDSPQIKAGNEAIAKYLGWYEDGVKGSWYVKDENAIYLAFSEYSPQNPWIGLPFDYAWEHLMPVIIKIGQEERHDNPYGRQKWRRVYHGEHPGRRLLTCGHTRQEGPDAIDDCCRPRPPRLYQGKAIHRVILVWYGVKCR